MTTDDILALLLAERDKLNSAIEALQGSTKRSGRPPKKLPAVATTPAPLKPKRKSRTAAQNRAQAARMKAYWAKKKRETKG
jgi:hypothetical protein